MKRSIFFISGPAGLPAWLCLLALFLPTLPLAAAEASKSRPGLAMAFEQGGATEHSVSSNVWLFVPKGESAHPFLPAGPFTATYSGQLEMDLRSDYLFQAELSGSVSVELNGVEVLSASGTDQVTPHTKPVRLNKGANTIRAVFKSDGSADAYLRLSWAEKPFVTTPIPSAQLSHLPTEAQLASESRLRGREIFIEHRCVRCHKQGGGTPGIPDLAMDGPSFEGIGSRLQSDWMRRWIENPRAIRDSARMPQVFHGPDAAGNAAAVAAYLSTLEANETPALKDPAPWSNPTPPPAEPAEADTRNLLEKLHCAACHQLPGATEPAPGKLSLAHVGSKFSPGRLAAFLRAPEAHYRWIRMPNFRLTAAEAEEIAKVLLGDAPAPTAPAKPAEELVTRGRELVRTSGCLNCHEGTGVTTALQAPGLAALKSRAWDKGCVGESRDSGALPIFGFTAEEKADLKAFGTTDGLSLSRHVGSEYALRTSRTLRCGDCHGAFDGFPAFEVLGGKLTPEWAASFISGRISYKPRLEHHPKGEPWLAARMPAFGAYGRLLGSGLAMSHGFSPVSPEPVAPDPDLAAAGHKLVGKAGGFSCISCHAVGSMAAMEVFESEGINLAWSGARLQKSFFLRWMKQPMSVDPNTKMPAYFDDEGQSPLADVLGGSAAKQLDAIWHYLRMGESMPKPSTGQ